MRVLIIAGGAFALLLGAAGFVFLPENERVEAAPAPYLACASGRITAYGSGQTSKAVAELAAISRWMEETRGAHGPGYDNWALAKGRWVSCKPTGKRDVMRCRIGAVPCRPKDATADMADVEGAGADMTPR